MGTDEEPVPDWWVAKLLPQVEELKKRPVEEHRWLLDNLSQLTPPSGSEAQAAVDQLDAALNAIREDTG